jgi:hypothetical protein
MAGHAKPDEQRWCAQQREDVVGYLVQQGLGAAQLGEWPAWYVMPAVAVWAVESLSHPGSVGWWAVSGDLPIDHTQCREPRHPRQALRDIGQRWREVAALWQDGKRSPVLQLGDPAREAELAPILEQRAGMLLDFAAKDDLWAE